MFVRSARMMVLNKNSRCTIKSVVPADSNSIRYQRLLAVDSFSILYNIVNTENYPCMRKTGGKEGVGSKKLTKFLKILGNADNY